MRTPWRAIPGRLKPPAGALLLGALALAGACAVAGFVQIGTGEGVREAFVGSGNFNSTSAHFNYSSNLGQSSFTLYANHFEDSGKKYGKDFIRPINPNLDSTTDPIRGNDLQFSIHWNHQLKLTLRHLDRAEDGLFTTYGGDLPFIFIDQRQRAASLQYKPIVGAWHIAFNAGWMQTVEHSNRQANSGASIYRERIDIKEQIWQLGFRMHRAIGENHRLLFGGEFQEPELLTGKIYNNLEDPFADIRYVGQLNNESSRDIYGIYGQYQYRLGKSLVTTLGLRHDQYSDFGGASSPRLAMVYSAPHAATFKLFYGEAFRAPSGRQRGSTIVGNPELKPEDVKTAEIVWLQRFSKAHCSFTFFNSRYYQKITTIPRPA